MSSPTQRTLDRLRKDGWEPDIVERRLRGGGRIWNKDFMGCVDILGIEAGDYGAECRIKPLPRAMLAVQACAGPSHAARVAKAKAEPRLRILLEAGVRFEVWSWSKRAVRNADGRKAKVKRWELRREAITLADLAVAYTEQEGATA